MEELIRDGIYTPDFPPRSGDSIIIDTDSGPSDFTVYQIRDRTLCEESPDMGSREFWFEDLRELRWHVLSREALYGVMARDLGITAAPVKLEKGVWEIGRKRLPGRDASKVLFIEAGVSASTLELVLLRDPFKAICLLSVGNVTRHEGLAGKTIVPGTIEVEDGRFASDAFEDLSASLNDNLRVASSLPTNNMKTTFMELPSPDYNEWKSIVLRHLDKRKIFFQAYLIGAGNMSKLVDKGIFEARESCDPLPDACWLQINGEEDSYEIIQVNDDIYCHEMTSNLENQKCYKFSIDEFIPHKLVREKFYALLAKDLEISVKVLRVEIGVWELGRWSSGDLTAKVIFVEAGVNDANLKLFLHTDQFLAICVLHHGSISLPLKIDGKAIVCGSVDVVEGRMVTDAFMDLAAIRIPTDPHHPSIVDLSNQMARGFESVRREAIQEVVATNGMRKELEEISGRADEFMTQLVAGFGHDSEMSSFFLLLLATGSDGKPLSYTKVGQQIGITKQAVEARFRKMEEKYPAAHRHLKTLRAREKTTQFSAISPKERRNEGIDSN